MAASATRLLARLSRLGLGVTYTGCLLYCVNNYIGTVVLCDGPSMEPTIFTGDCWVVEKISRWRNTLQKGDIVIAQSHADPFKYVCKRIQAMEGDRVFNELDCEYVKIPRGHVWLEGDNKRNSCDSREYGAVPYGLITSRMVYKLWSAKDTEV